MADSKIIDTLWDDNPVDVTTEVGIHMIVVMALSDGKEMKALG